jgi:hypothetical protein
VDLDEDMNPDACFYHTRTRIDIGEDCEKIHNLAPTFLANSESIAWVCPKELVESQKNMGKPRADECTSVLMPY